MLFESVIADVPLSQGKMIDLQMIDKDNTDHVGDNVTRKFHSAFMVIESVASIYLGNPIHLFIELSLTILTHFLV